MASDKPPDDTAPRPPGGAGPASDGVFEMLWDCDFCGTRGLLGKSHRHCPSCGAPQDPAKRYFPAAGQEVAARNDDYIGADRICPACASPGSARANNCGNCGSPLDGAKEVQLKTHPNAPPVPLRGAVETKKAVPPRRGLLFGCLGILALGLIFLVVALTWKKDATVTVSALTWRREIAIEKLAPKNESAWCDALPGDAYDVQRSREIRDHRKVPDGEDCHDVNVDRGDGTFVRKTECTTRYRDEPVYGDKCRFRVDRWQTTRSLKETGSAQQAPRWPGVALDPGGNCRGCEREGSRSEAYKAELIDDKGRRHACDLPAAVWSRLQVGARQPARKRVIGGGIECGSLR